MMGRRRLSVCNLRCRPPVLFLILLPVFLTKGFNVDVNFSGEENATCPILKKADVSEVGQNKAGQRGNTEGRIEDQGSVTLSSSRDRQAGRVDAGDIKESVEFYKIKEAQEERENLGKEFCRLLVHDRELLDLLLNNTYRGHISNLSRSRISFRTCGVGENPSTIYSMSRLRSSQMRELTFYDNQQGERVNHGQQREVNARMQRNLTEGKLHDGSPRACTMKLNIVIVAAVALVLIILFLICFIVTRKSRGATKCSHQSSRGVEMASSNSNSEQEVQTISLPLVEDLDSNDSFQVHRGQDPFWLVMIGQFGPEGGILSCEDSDVIVEIPPGAIPPNRRDQRIIAKISLCPDSIGPKLTYTNSLWLSPLVDIESPGLDRFDKNVKIKLPHRAQGQPGWTISVRYTYPTADTKCNWQADTTPATVDQAPVDATFPTGKDTDTQPVWNCVEQTWHSRTEEKASNDVTRLTFSVDEKYVNISTSHFSLYVCSGCSKTHPLNLEAVMYWHHYKVEGVDQIDLNVYIIDTIKDTRKASVESNERSSKLAGATSGMTGYYPLGLEYTSGEDSSLTIFVDKECMGDDWKWSLKSYNGRLPAKREMSVESVIRGCCSSLMSTQEMFTFVPTDPSKHEQLSFFQAMIGIKQLNSQKLVMKMPILVTVPLTKGCGAVGATNTDNTSIGVPIISDEEIDFVGERLPFSKCPRLYHKLTGNGADIGIEEIQHRDSTDSREKIRSALVVLRRSEGRMATIEKLITALQELELPDIADQFQSTFPEKSRGSEESRGTTTECFDKSQRGAEMGSSNSSVFTSEQGIQSDDLSLVEDLDSTDPNQVQVFRGKDPFWLVMIGLFGPEGGILTCEDSDVIVEIPPGSIPPDRRHQLILARISLCPDSIGPKLTDTNSLWLSPLVDLKSPGLDRFHKNVKIKLPHRAQVQPGWTFSVHYTDPTADTKTDTTPATVVQAPEAATFLPGKDTDTQPIWTCVEQIWHARTEEKASNDVTRLTFSVDEKYVNISTSHFTQYVCSGCSETHPLNLEAVVFWQHYKRLNQMDLIVYIVDVIKDTRKALVESNERSLKLPDIQSGRTAYSPLSLKYTSGEASSLAIIVDEECMGDDRKWSLRTYGGIVSAKREMTVDSVIRGCCSPRLSTREVFTFFPRDPTEDRHLTFFRAMIVIKQLNSRDEVRPTPILVTVSFAEERRPARPSTDVPIRDEEIVFVAERLPCSKWRPLYRKLIGKGADIGIEQIMEQHPTNAKEQIHSALVGWKRTRGRMATVEKLITDLQQVGLQDLADELQSFCRDFNLEMDTHL